MHYRSMSTAPQDQRETLAETLSPAEKRVWAAFGRGEQVDLRTGNPLSDNPGDVSSWDSSRRIRGEVLAALLLGACDPVPGYTPALRLIGALVAGDIDLKQAVVQAPLELTYCRISDVIRLNAATLRSVDLSNTYLSWFNAESATIDGYLSMVGCQCDGEIRLIGAHVTSNMVLTNAKLSCTYNLPLTMDSAQIDGSVNCGGASITGEARLLDAHIAGQLNLTGATVSNPNGRSLSLDRVKIDGGMYCSGMTATGQLRLLGTQVAGELTMNDASIDNAQRVVIEGYSLSVAGSMFCQRLKAQGEVRLVGSHITGQLDLNGAQFTNPGQNALTADGITVDSITLCGAGFHATGAVRLPHAQLSKVVTMSGGAHFENPGGVGLQAQGLTLNGDLVGEGTRVDGELRLAASTITGQLDLRNTNIENRGDTAVDLDGSVVGQDVLLTNAHLIGELRMMDARLGAQLMLTEAKLDNDGDIALRADRVAIAAGLFGHSLQVTGMVRLAAAHIVGELSLEDARLEGARDGTALHGERLSAGDVLCQGTFHAIGEVRLVGAQIAGQLGLRGATLDSTNCPALNFQQATADSLWLPGVTISSGIVDLTAAKVATLYDKPPDWPPACKDGFEYADLQPYAAASGEAGRLEWLSRSPEGYRPQPYEQLAAYYRKLGNDQEARTVLLAKQRRRRSTEMPLAIRVFGYVLDGLVGYGYRPLRAFSWLVFLLAFGSLYFAANHPAPVDPAHHPHFQPILYAASLIVPVVNLGENDAWNNSGLPQWVAAFLIAMGWILATAVVAAITRVLTRN
jgi:hypothetical protein